VEVGAEAASLSRPRRDLPLELRPISPSHARTSPWLHSPIRSTTSQADNIDQPVVDETNLPGAWSFTIKWTGRDQLERQGADGISIFAAVEKQLGLKLELKTAPRPVFQVASVDETPTPNLANIAEALPEPPDFPFEVTVIKPSAPDEQGYGHITGHQIQTRAIPLMFLITFGWTSIRTTRKASRTHLNGWTPQSSTFSPRPETTMSAGAKLGQSAPRERGALAA
jgi:hypothetical protein